MFFHFTVHNKNLYLDHIQDLMNWRSYDKQTVQATTELSNFISSSSVNNLNFEKISNKLLKNFADPLHFYLD